MCVVLPGAGWQTNAFRRCDNDNQLLAEKSRLLIILLLQNSGCRKNGDKAANGITCFQSIIVGILSFPTQHYTTVYHGFNLTVYW